jgi:hypothetical protein
MIYYVYLIELRTAEGEWRVCYAGATHRDSERIKEHLGLVGGAARVAASVDRHGPKNHRARIVSKLVLTKEEEAELLQLTKGALPLSVMCLETYLMQKHDTVHPNLKRMRDLLAEENAFFDHKHPDVTLTSQPINFQLNCKRSAGAQHAEAVAAAGVTFENPTATLCIYTEEEQEWVFGQIFSDLGVEPLETVMVACAKPADAKRIVFDIDSPFMKARALRVEYEEKDSWQTVSRDAVFTQMMEVQALDATNADLADYFKNLKKAFHSDKHISLGIQMTAREAVGVFTMIESWTGAFEEAALLNNKEVAAHVAKATEWREWMRANEGAKPTEKASGDVKSAEEKTAEKKLGSAMRDWRHGFNSHPPQEHRNVYLVLLRDFASFAQFCYGMAEKTHTNVTKVNRLLCTGHGNQAARNAFPNLANFPSACPACHSLRPEYGVLTNYLNGSNGAQEEALLQGVDPAYAVWLRETHASKVDACKARAALYDEGIRVKRQKKSEAEKAV